MQDKYNTMFDLMESKDEDYSKYTDSELDALLKHHEKDHAEHEENGNDKCAKETASDIKDIKAEIEKRK